MSFWADLGAELTARRLRLRRAMKDRNASLLELVQAAGFLLAIVGPLIFPPPAYPFYLGALPLLGAFGAYLLLEGRRQGALAAGAEPEAVKKRYDLMTLLAVFAFSLAAYAMFAFDLRQHATPAAEEAESPAEWTPPDDALDVTIAPPARP